MCYLESEKNGSPSFLQSIKYILKVSLLSFLKSQDNVLGNNCYIKVPGPLEKVFSREFLNHSRNIWYVFSK